jgi:hypothetical protein
MSLTWLRLTSLRLRSSLKILTRGALLIFAKWLRKKQKNNQPIERAMTLKHHTHENQKPGEALGTYYVRIAANKTRAKNALLRAEREILEAKIKQPPSTWKASDEQVTADHELRHPRPARR